MNQSNITIRQQKENDKGKATEQPAAESSSGSGDKLIAQSACLASFSAEQADALTTFISNAINNAVESINGHLNKEMAILSSNITTLQTAVENLIAFEGENSAAQASSLPTFSIGKPQDPRTPSKHVAAESTSSAGERPAAKGGFLADLSTETPRHLSQRPNIKFESTPQPELNSHIADPSHKPNYGGIPTQYGLESRLQTQRWRSEELGSFDPNVDDIYTFADRIREVAEIRDPRLVQLNLSLQLRGKAKRWFELELSQADKAYLYHPANGITVWVSALVNRFGSLLLQQLYHTSYGRADAAAKKDPIDYVHDVIALTLDRPMKESLMEAYLRFEPVLQVNLVPPDDQTTVHDFMDQINAKKAAWFTIYATFSQKDEPSTNQFQGSNRGQRPQSNGYSPKAPVTAAGTCPYPTMINGPAGQRYPARPKAYHAEVQNEDDEDDDWDQVNY